MSCWNNNLEVFIFHFIHYVKDVRDGDGEVIAAINCSTLAGKISKGIMLKEFLPLSQENASEIREAMKIIKKQ